MNDDKEATAPSVSNELLNCPFCGSTASLKFTQRRHDFYDAVECDNEKCEVFITSAHGDDYVHRWNTRAKHEAI